MKYAILIILSITIFACSRTNKSEKAEMYQASELSAMMREMVVWSKEAKAILAAGDTITTVPKGFYDLAKQTATRGEHNEAAFQGMVPAYTNALKGIERRDSQQFYYDASIQACKSCHGVYCGGPLSVIDQL
jgi:hypothetical protein